MADERIRLDKWLWAARFFKARSAAAQAVAGGKVHRNGERSKPAHEVRPGDELRIRRGIFETVVIVREVSDRRRGAPEAAALYEETAESRERREQLRAAAAVPRGLRDAGRPSKRDRREILRFTRGEG